MARGPKRRRVETDAAAVTGGVGGGGNGNGAGELAFTKFGAAAPRDDDAQGSDEPKRKRRKRSAPKSSSLDGLFCKSCGSSLLLPALCSPKSRQRMSALRESWHSLFHLINALGFHPDTETTTPLA